MIEDWGLEDTDYFRFVGNDGPQYLTLGSPQLAMAMSSSNADYPHIKGLDLDLGGGSDVVDFIPGRMQIIGIDLGAGDDFITIQDPERYSHYWTGPEVDTFSLEKFDGGDNGDYGDHLSFRYYDMKQAATRWLKVQN